MHPEVHSPRPLRARPRSIQPENGLAELGEDALGGLLDVVVVGGLDEEAELSDEGPRALGLLAVEQHAERLEGLADALGLAVLEGLLEDLEVGRQRVLLEVAIDGAGDL